MKPKRSLSVVGLCFFLIMSTSWGATLELDQSYEKAVVEYFEIAIAEQYSSAEETPTWAKMVGPCIASKSDLVTNRFKEGFVKSLLIFLKEGQEAMDVAIQEELTGEELKYFSELVELCVKESQQNIFEGKEEDLQKLMATKICEKCELTGAYLIKEDLTGANLTRSNLTRAMLTRSDLTDSNLYYTDLTEANLFKVSLENANLTKADLQYADLIGANLSRSNLTRADLRGADLSEANLIRADLTKANLTRASLVEVDLTKANLSKAIFCDTIMSDGTINNSGC